MIPLLLAPAASVAVWWVGFATLPVSGESSLWVYIPAALPPVAALVWSYLRMRSVLYVVLMAAGMVISTVILWYVAFAILVYIASLSCPENAYECPI